MSGVIALTIFLAVTPQVVQSSITGSGDSLNEGSINKLKNDINNVCSGEVDSVGGTIDISRGISIELEGNTMNIEGLSTNSNTDSSYTLECEIDSSKTIEQTQPYEVTNNPNGGYRIT